MFGNGVGTNGAGGPGILQTLGMVAVAVPPLPLVTGVFGGLTVTLATAVSSLAAPEPLHREGRYRSPPRRAQGDRARSRVPTIEPQARNTERQTPLPHHPSSRLARCSRKRAGRAGRATPRSSIRRCDSARR